MVTLSFYRRRRNFGEADSHAACYPLFIGQTIIVRPQQLCGCEDHEGLHAVGKLSLGGAAYQKWLQWSDLTATGDPLVTPFLP